MLTPAQAGEQIRGLVSGRPIELARSWQILALQAYVDASGTGEPDNLSIAGYVAAADEWAKFSTAWQKRLDEAHLKRFKMSEMAGRLEIAGYFYRVIEEYDIRAAISIVIETDALRKLVNEFPWPPNMEKNKAKLGNPYYLGFRAIIENLARHQHAFGFREPVDFIFDDQAEKTPLLAAWTLLKVAAKPDIRKFLGETPIFRDDEKFLPLQAADLYAWWILKWKREGTLESGSLKELAFPWSAKRKINRFNFTYGEAELEAGMKDIIEKADALAQLAPDEESARRVLKAIEAREAGVSMSLPDDDLSWLNPFLKKSS